MKIAKVEALILRAGDDRSPEAARPRTSEPARTKRALANGFDINRSRAAYPGCTQTVLVKVTSDNGLIGWGESHAPLAPEVATSIIDNLLGPIIIGRDPRAVDVLWEAMYSSMRIRGHHTGFMMEAMSGIDIALWDLFGKSVGLPIYQLLGGGYRDRVNAYASGVRGSTPDEMAEAALGYVRDGFTAMKMGISAAGPEGGIAFVRAVTEAIGDTANLLIDAQGGYDFHTALMVGRQLQDLGVYWVEDPLPPEDIAGHRRLAENLDIAVATGEALCSRWGFRDWIVTGAADIVLPDICRCGGISECRKIGLLADAYNVPWAGHVSMGTNIHIAATLQVAAASPNMLICECPTRFHTNPLGNPLQREPLLLENGQLIVPQKPGLGIEIDEAALAEYVV